jgi:hypothetical protein
MKKGLLVLWIILMAFPAIAGWSRDSDGNYGWMDGKENSALVTLLPFLRTWGLVDAANGTDPAPGSYYATIVFDDGYGVRVSGDSVTDKIWWDIDGCMLNLEKIDVTVDTLLFCADSDGVTKRGSISDIYAGYVETDPVFGAWLLGPPNISTFTNDSGYITSTDGSGWVDRGTYIEQVTGSDEIAMRQSGSGGAPTLGHVTIPWLSGDTKTTLYVGSSNINNNDVAINGVSYSNYGVYGLSNTSHGVIGGSTDGVGVEGSSGTNYGVYGKSSSLYGVYGTGGTIGVYGYSALSRGVCGESTSAQGVYGIATSGSAVYGAATTGKSGYFYRNTTTSENPVVDIVQDHATANTAAALRVQQDSTGPIVELFDGATSVAQFQDGGHLAMGPGDLSIMETTSITGDTCLKMYQSSDDGILDIYQNNSVQHRLHGNGTTVFNELASDVDFRIESADDANMLYLDAEQNGIALRYTSVPSTTGSREDVRLYTRYGSSGQAPNDYSAYVIETDAYGFFQFLKPDGNNTETAVLFGRPSAVYWGWVHHWRDGSAREMVAIAADSGNRKYYMDVNGHYIHGLDNAAGSYYMRYNTGTEEISYTTSARWHKDVLEEHWKLTPEKMKKYLQIPVSRAIYKSDKQEIICCIADNVAAQLPELAIHEVIKCDVSDDGNPMHRRTVNKVTERWGGVKYEEFPLYNLEILKQHEARITDLESQVAELRTLIEGLVKDNEALRKRIDGHE